MGAAEMKRVFAWNGWSWCSLLGALLFVPLLATVASGQGSAPYRAIVERVEWEVSDTGARVIVVVKGRVDYSSHTVGASPGSKLAPRAYVDLKPARLGSAIDRNPIAVNDRLVQRLRIGQFDADTARIVVDLAEPALFQVTTAENPPRLILELVPPRNRPPAAPARRREAPNRSGRAVSRERESERRSGRRAPTSASVATPPAAEPSPRPTPSASPLPSPTPSVRPSASPRPTATPTATPRRYSIVIDPGHGGQDPGARGVGGDYEKKITLAVARMLVEDLEEEGDIDVVLTRTGDDSLSLEQRTAIANAQGADLFVSIHANASDNRSASGIETYTLNNTNDQATIRLATLENGLKLTGVPSEQSDLAYILSDLLQTGKEDESIALAEAVQGQLVRYLGKRWRGVTDLGVKKGPFYVLVGAYMPCVLVELGFLTHPSEGARLATPRYQRDLAEGLARGIRSFLESSDPNPNL